MKRPVMKQTDPRLEVASIGNTLVIGNVLSRNKIYKKLRRLSDRRTRNSTAPEKHQLEPDRIKLHLAINFVLTKLRLQHFANKTP